MMDLMKNKNSKAAPAEVSFLFRILAGPMVLGVILLVSWIVADIIADKASLRDTDLSWMDNTPKQVRIQACVDEGGQWIDRRCYFVSDSDEAK